jgi:hypothetical protein
VRWLRVDQTRKILRRTPPGYTARLDTAVGDAAADDVAGGVIAELRGGDDRARMALQQGVGAGLGLAITRQWGYVRQVSGTAPDDAPAEAALSPGDWTGFLDALIAANFWALDPIDRRGARSRRRSVG